MASNGGKIVLRVVAAILALAGAAGVVLGLGAFGLEFVGPPTRDPHGGVLVYAAGLFLLALGVALILGALIIRRAFRNGHHDRPA